WLAGRPEIQLDKDGDPRVGMAGGSYGGAIALLAAGHDDRVDAIAPAITYFDLADALFPGGVFKKLWAGIFVNSGGGCDRFEPALCAMYERVAESGVPDAEARALLEERSPSAVADRIDVPALLVQGQSDSLFPLGHADAAARAIRANGAPVEVDWIAGGHDGGDPETDRVQRRVRAWFDRHLKGDRNADTGPAFRVSRTGGVDSTDGRATLRGASADRYPGLSSGPETVRLTGFQQRFDNPAGANPPAVSALPGLSGAGGGLSQLSSLGVGVSLDFPGQHARFQSEPLHRDLRITGSPQITARVTSTSDDAVLFGKLYDVGPDGRQQVLPSQLVTPLRVENAKAGQDVTLTLPAVDHEVRKGHRLRLVIASTDLGYASPAAPATYTVDIEGHLTVPTAPAVTTAAAPLPAWVCWLPLAGAVAALVLVLTGRPRHLHRRHRGPPDGAHRAGRDHRGGPAARLGVVAAARRSRRRPGPGPHRPPPHHRSCTRPRTGRPAPGDHRTEQALRPLRRPVRRAGPVLPRRTRPGPRPARPGPGRQDHHVAHADGADHPRRGRDTGLRPRRAARRPGAVPGRRLRGGRGLPAAPVRAGEPGTVLAGHRPPGRGRPPRRGPAHRGPRRRPLPRGAHLLPGHAPAPRHRAGHARPARPADPGRADQRPGPAPDPRDAGSDDPLRDR